MRDVWIYYERDDEPRLALCAEHFAAILAAATAGFLAPIETACGGTVGVVSGEVCLMRQPANVLDTLCSIGLMRQLQAQRR